MVFGTCNTDLVAANLAPISTNNDERDPLRLAASNSENNLSNNGQLVCEVKRGGFCVTHNVMGKKIYVTTCKWKDRGNGKGYGNVYSRTTKYICEGKRKGLVDTHNSTNNQNLNLKMVNLHGGG